MEKPAKRNSRYDDSRFRRYIPLFAGEILALLLLTGMIVLIRPQLSLSFFVGGLIHFFAALFFAMSVFHRSGIVSSQRFVRAFYRGEVVKFFVTALGFILAFNLLETPVAPALFAGFLLMMVLHTLTLACVSD